MIADSAWGLTKESRDLAEHLKTVILSDDDITSIELFYWEVREGLDAATLDDKRRYFDLLDVQTRIALENDEKVVYVRTPIHTLNKTNNQSQR